ELEAWGDARAHDGTPSIIQPVIAPLYDGRSPHVLMNVLATGQTTNAHDRVRATWRGIWQVDGAAFEHRWRDALSRGVAEDGLAPGSRYPVNRARDDATTVASRNSPDGATAESTPPSAHPRQPESASTTLLAVFTNDSILITGEYANNSWLQELPRPY